MAGVEQLLSKRFLSCLPYSGALARENRLLLGLFSSVPVGLSWLLASLASSLECMMQKQNLCTSPLCISLDSVVPNWLPSSTFQSLFVCFIHNFGFSVVLSLRNREKSTPSS